MASFLTKNVIKLQLAGNVKGGKLRVSPLLSAGTALNSRFADLENIMNVLMRTAFVGIIAVGACALSSKDLHDGLTFERCLDAVDGHARANILYDPSHLLLQQLDCYAFIDIHHERIAAFHVKTRNSGPTDNKGHRVVSPTMRAGRYWLRQKRNVERSA